MEEYKAFVLVAEMGSFTEAAKRLDMTVASVSRRVRTLEERLQVRLFNRTTRRVSPTEAGQGLYEKMRGVLAEALAAEEEARQHSQGLHGLFRITAPMSYGVAVLTPIVARFAKSFPSLRMQVILEDRTVDLVEQGFDLALRIGEPPDSSLIAQKITTIPRHICASPQYLQHHGVPTHPDELASHFCLHYENLSFQQEWRLSGSGHGQKYSLPVANAMGSNNGEMLRVAVEHGVGIAVLPEFLIAESLKAGRLQKILEPYAPPAVGLFGVYPTRAFVPRKVRAFLAHLREELAAGSL